MHLCSIAAVIGLLALPVPAWADLKPWQDYEVGEESTEYAPKSYPVIT